MKNVNWYYLKLDDEVFIKAVLMEKYTISNCSDTGFIFEIDDDNIYKNISLDNWIPFKGGKCPVDIESDVLIIHVDGYNQYDKAKKFILTSDLWDTIIAYQVITPYKPPREKIIFKNKKEMLTELMLRGELYLNKEGNEHVYFSEDDRYTLGYVHEDGRSEPAEDILDCLEFWVEQ